MIQPTNPAPLTDAALAELKALHAGLHCSFGGIGGKIVDSFPALIARLREAERERDAWRAQLKRVVGEHSSPNDCYATGPLTGDPIRDLISCPSCEAIAMEAAAQLRREGE